MSSARAARWAAQRATWKLANRGDTHLAADRRLYKAQLSELRKEWLGNDLHARRAAYLKSREEEAQRKEKQAARKDARSKSNMEEDSQLAAARAEQERFVAEQLRRQKESKKKMADRRAARHEEAETEFRKQWLGDLLKEYDVEGTEQANQFTQYRKRSFLTPENFEKRLHMLLVRNKSPIDNWNGIARKLEQDEQRAALDERTGGRLLHSPAEPVVPSPQAATSAPAPGAAVGDGPRGPAAAGARDDARGGSDAGPPGVGAGGAPNDDALLKNLKSAMAELEVDDDSPSKK